MNGILIIDKPKGPTCQQVLNRIGRLLQIRKLGHSGTLDPFATGVLPVFLGAATKLIPFIDEGRKIYEATLELGKITDTLDETGQVLELREVPLFSDSDLQQVFSQFLGEHEQTPPLYSAVKVKGRPLYHYARQGKSVKASPRKIKVFQLTLLRRENECLYFKTEVSRGTYIRVLASEIAQALGTVGILKELRRLQSGPFCLGQSISLDDLESKNIIEIQQIMNKNLSFSLKEFERVEFKDPSLIHRLLNGQAVPWEWKAGPLQKGDGLEKTVMALGNDEILSICRFESSSGSPRGQLKPLRILHIPCA